MAKSLPHMVEYPLHMSSKSAAGEGGRELTLQILSLLMRGRPLTQEEIFSHFPYRRAVMLRRVREMKRLQYLSKKKTGYILTTRGKRHLTEDEIWNLEIPLAKQWDGKWRMVLFDIPVNRKKYRDILRLRLRELKLVRYQDSVWVYPYPLHIVISKIVAFYYISEYVSFATAEKLSGEKNLRRHFNI